VIRQRIVSALVLAALLVTAVLWLPALASTAVLSLVLLVAAWEWSGFPAGANRAARVSFLAATLASCAALWWLTSTAQGLQAALWVAVAFWSVALLWIALLPQRVSRALVFGAGIAALSLAWMALARMRLDWPDGRYWVMYALLIVWIADSGAYFAGRAWGTSRLAPQVSPGKTWAGLWGGLLATAALALVAARVLPVPAPDLVLLTVAVGAWSVVGDLTESLCKRFAGLKDSGTVIPGHGGVLDRFDSLLAAAPCLMWAVLQFGGYTP
jgi:phosphatidate cytidylyltransferase